EAVVDVDAGPEVRLLPVLHGIEVRRGHGRGAPEDAAGSRLARRLRRTRRSASTRRGCPGRATPATGTRGGGRAVVRVIATPDDRGRSEPGASNADSTHRRSPGYPRSSCEGVREPVVPIRHRSP